MTVSASQAEVFTTVFSRDNFMQNPVVAFNVGGINEIITHKKMVIYVKILIH